MEPLWTVKDVAVYLGVTPMTVYRLIYQGYLPGVKITGKRYGIWRFDSREVIRWIEEGGLPHKYRKEKA